VTMPRSAEYSNSTGLQLVHAARWNNSVRAKSQRQFNHHYSASLVLPCTTHWTSTDTKLMVISKGRLNYVLAV